MEDDLMFNAHYSLINEADSLGASDFQVKRLQNLLDEGATEITMKQSRVVRWKAGEDTVRASNRVTFTATIRF